MRRKSGTLERHGKKGIEKISESKQAKFFGGGVQLAEIGGGRFEILGGA
jgi:hypothetical protein